MFDTLTVKQVAKIFNKSESWVYDHADELRAVKIGGSIIFTESKLKGIFNAITTEKRQMEGNVRPFGYHALRRYVASVLMDSGKLSSKRIQRILRHKSVTTTERYIQNLADEMRADLELLPKHKVPQVVPRQIKKELTISG